MTPLGTLRVAIADEFTRPASIVAARRALLCRIGTSAQTLLNVARQFVAWSRECVAGCARRRRKRLELIDYLAWDHRAASDMGMTRDAAESWVQEPFWRP